MRYVLIFFAGTIVHLSATQAPIIIKIQTKHNQVITTFPTLDDFPQIQQAFASAKKNRGTVALAAAGIAYLATLWYIQRAQRLSNDTQAWCNWQQSTPLEQLVETPQEELYAQLKKALEERYYDRPNTLTLLSRFFDETNEELNLLTRYLALEKILSACWLAKLFLITDAGIRAAHIAIKRLTFLRSIVATELEPRDMVRRIFLINCPSLGSPA